MADNKAINAIKAHASCDHERALYGHVQRPLSLMCFSPMYVTGLCIGLVSVG